MAEPTVLVRANRNGHPCPPWCTADHDRELIPGHFKTSHTAEPVHAWALVCAVLQPAVGVPKVQVSTPSADGGSLFLEPVLAGYLAVLVRELATATPEQHHELAAAIRDASAVIAEQPGG